MHPSCPFKELALGDFFIDSEQTGLPTLFRKRSSFAAVGYPQVSKKPGGTVQFHPDEDVDFVFTESHAVMPLMVVAGH